MMNLGIFCTVARTELKEKFPDVKDGVLDYLNYAIKQAYALSESERDALAAKLEKVKSSYKNLCGAIGDADDTEQGTKEHDDAIGKMFETMRDGWQHVND